MSGNYPDNVSAGDPHAPWNWPDAEPCPDCGSTDAPCENSGLCQLCCAEADAMRSCGYCEPGHVAA